MFANHLAAGLALMLAGTAAAADPNDPVISEGCVLSSIRDQLVPASDSGVIVKLAVEQGDRVKEGMELARVDDREAQAQQTVKRKDHEVAVQNAKSDVKIRYQDATAKVALQAWRKLKQANAGSDKAVSEIEVLRAELEYQKAVLGTEQAKEEHVTDALTAEAKKAEVDAAEVGVTRRILRAPFDGVVVQVLRREGEWVSPGDPVMQIVRIDRLRITTTIPARDWAPSDVQGRNVTVEVQLPHAKVEKVPGRIAYASPVVYEGELTIEAEIETPMQDGRPLVYAGLPATMTIHVSQPVAAVKRPVAARPNEKQSAAPQPEVRRTSAVSQAPGPVRPATGAASGRRTSPTADAGAAPGKPRERTK